MLTKLGSAIADVPTDKNVMPARMYWSYMYKSQSKRDFNIFLGGYCDIVKSSLSHHLLCYPDLPSETLRHNLQTVSIVCKHNGSKGIIKKFNLLVEKDTQ